MLMKKRKLFHGEAKTCKSGQKTDTVYFHLKNDFAANMSNAPRHNTKL